MSACPTVRRGLPLRMEPSDVDASFPSRRHARRSWANCASAILRRRRTVFPTATPRRATLEGLSGRARHVARIDQPVPPPPDVDQPRASDCDGPNRRYRVTRVDLPGPSIEPASRRRRIEPHLRRQPRGVLPGIEQNVAQNVSDLAGRAQHAQMVPIGQHRPTTAEDPVRSACEPRADRDHPAAQQRRSVRFDEEMHVIALQRVVDESEPFALARRRHADLELTHEPRRAKRWDVGTNAYRHVCGVTRGEARPRHMGHAGALALRLPTCASPPAAPRPARDERQRQLPARSRHAPILLDSAGFVDSAHACYCNAGTTPPTAVRAASVLETCGGTERNPKDRQDRVTYLAGDRGPRLPHGGFAERRRMHGSRRHPLDADNRNERGLDSEIPTDMAFSVCWPLDEVEPRESGLFSTSRPVQVGQTQRPPLAIALRS